MNKELLKDFHLQGILPPDLFNWLSTKVNRTYPTYSEAILSLLYKMMEDEIALQKEGYKK